MATKVSYSVNEKLTNVKYALKNIKKDAIELEIRAIGAAIVALNPKFEAYEPTGDETKAELLETYGKYVTLLHSLEEAAEKAAAEAAEKAETEKWRKEQEEIRRTKKADKQTPAENRKANKEAEKAAKAEKKAKKETKVKIKDGGEEKEMSYSRFGSAQDRLTAYTAELTEKEAVKNPDKTVTKRIASLKRKIARAEAALKK